MKMKVIVLYNLHCIFGVCVLICAFAAMNLW